MTKHLAGIIFMAFSAALAASELPTNAIQGVWQSSFAYNGKAPWSYGTLIIKESQIFFEDEGRERNSFTYSILFSEGSLIAVQAEDKDRKKVIYMFEMSEKFQCQPKTPLRYDTNCTGHDADSPFRLLICESAEMAKEDKSSCTYVDRYFKFEDQQIIKLGELSVRL